MKLKIINHSSNGLPKYATKNSAGMDLRASLQKAEIINSGERRLIPTGLFIELPVGYEAQIRPRSGLAFKHGVTVLNSPGTIDADYRGEIGVLLINHGNAPFTVHNGDRIAQMIVARHEHAELDIVFELSDTERGEGGFGHTGNK